MSSNVRKLILIFITITLCAMINDSALAYQLNQSGIIIDSPFEETSPELLDSIKTSIEAEPAEFFPDTPFQITSVSFQPEIVDSVTGTEQNTIEADDLPFPSWWSGECNKNNHPGSYSRGSYRGVHVCAPNGGLTLVNFFPGAFGEYEWQCVEFAMRYMYLAFETEPYNAPLGNNVYTNYPGTTGIVLRKIPNGSVGDAPKPGDVIAFYKSGVSNGKFWQWGHAAVVIESSVSDDGYGYIKTLNQNWSGSSPVSKRNVNNWIVDDGAVGWLRAPINDEPPVTGEVLTPVPNAMLSETVQISGSAQADNDYVDHVEIWINGAYRGNAIYLESYNFFWDWITNSAVYKDGAYTIQVKGVMASGSFAWLPFVGTGGQTSVTVIIDNQGPGIPSTVSSNCQAKNDVWQNSCPNPSFTWSEPVDPGVAISRYKIYWGPYPYGNPDILLTDRSFTPPPVNSSQVNYLRLQSQNANGRWSNPSTIFVFRYDNIPPDVTAVINQGAEKTTQVSISLDINASDSHSGIHQMRLTNYPDIWPNPRVDFSSTKNWNIFPIRTYPQNIYIEVSDKAGNTSIASDAIVFDPVQPLPYSSSYRLCGDALSLAGGVGLSSNYQMVFNLGQNAVSHNNSGEYMQNAGVLSDLNACWMPINIFHGYTMQQSVVAAAGGLRYSNQYRMGGTFGQALGMGDQPSTSPSSQHLSGYWANFDGQVPMYQASGLQLPTPVIPPNPTSQPTPTPVPEAYRVSINNEAASTNNLNLQVNLQAPSANQVRLSNDPVEGEDGWYPYQTSFSWMGDLSEPDTEAQWTRVYAWFKNQDDVIMGPYNDEILFDPVAPEGYIEWAGSEMLPTDVWLYATDMGSGVEIMRWGYAENLSTSEWIPYTNYVSADASNGVVYAQFRDYAGNISPVYAAYPVNYETQIYLPIINK